MIKLTVKQNEIIKATIEGRVKMLADAGMKISVQDGKPHVDEGALETVILNATKEVQFIWYAPDEEIP